MLERKHELWYDCHWSVVGGFDDRYDLSIMERGGVVLDLVQGKYGDADVKW